MNRYNSRMFRSLANTSLGKELWFFLNDDIIIASMQTATYLSKTRRVRHRREVAG